jgi:peptidoglycan/xylan/chitin deacetylase (PgdA/CDA1 family)
MLALMAGTSVAAAVAAGYHTMAPRSQLYGHTFVGGGPDSRQLALTFDDGPNDPWTPRLLEVLERRQVRATFFMIGNFVRQKPTIARQVVEAGHVVANHTFSHPNLIFADVATVERQVSECERALTDAIGDHSRLFRPPFGGRTPMALRAIGRQGLDTVMWRVSGFDWNAKSARQIEQKVVAGVRGGDVILLHDGGHRHMGADRSCTVTAVDHLIAWGQEQGYNFVTVPEMKSHDGRLTAK